MIAFHWNHTCSLQLFFPKTFRRSKKHGVIMDFCPRGSHHQLKSRRFAWAMPSETIIRSLMVYCGHFKNVHHKNVVYICQLVPRVQYVLILSHVLYSVQKYVDGVDCWAIVASICGHQGVLHPLGSKIAIVTVVFAPPWYLRLFPPCLNQLPHGAVVESIVDGRRVAGGQRQRARRGGARRLRRE